MEQKEGQLRVWMQVQGWRHERVELKIHFDWKRSWTVDVRFVKPPAVGNVGSGACVRKGVQEMHMTFWRWGRRRLSVASYPDFGRRAEGQSGAWYLWSHEKLPHRVPCVLTRLLWRREA